MRSPESKSGAPSELKRQFRATFDFSSAREILFLPRGKDFSLWNCQILYRPYRMKCSEEETYLGVWSPKNCFRFVVKIVLLRFRDNPKQLFSYLNLSVLDVSFWHENP